MGQGESQCKWRLGVVSFLNAKPLIAGLDRDERIELIYEVPARLSALLDQGAVDVALVPVVDLLGEGRSWQVLSDACIGCDGETLTVRVFSRIEPASISRLHVDGDSHTSVALARVIWKELYGRRLETVPFLGDETVEACEAVLLIGDKVVNRPLIGYEIETDLGASWKSLTSLPFVFAVWAAPRGMESGDLADRLSRARDLGVRSAELIAADFAPGLGWPVTLARRYLTTRLNFTLGPRQRLGMARFFELARRNGLIPAGEQPIFA
jgi:chorismate dehydratase